MSRVLVLPEFRVRANWLRYLAFAVAFIAAGFLAMATVALAKLYRAGYEINWLRKDTTKEVSLYGGVVRLRVPMAWAVQVLDTSPHGERRYVFWEPYNRHGQLSTYVMSRTQSPKQPHAWSDLYPDGGTMTEYADGSSFMSYRIEDPMQEDPAYVAHIWKVARQFEIRTKREMEIFGMTYFVPRKEADSTKTQAEVAFLKAAAANVRFEPVARAAGEQTVAANEMESSASKLHDLAEIGPIALLVFVGVVILCDIALVRIWPRTKRQWIGIGQLVNVLSIIGLFLGSFSIYQAYLKHDLTVAEIEAITQAQRGVYFVNSLMEPCDRPETSRWNVHLTRDWRNPKSESVAFTCEELKPAVQILNRYFATGVAGIMHSGEFIEPYFKIGMPISLYTAQIDGELGALPDLSDLQKEILLERVYNFMGPYIKAMTFIQGQQENLLATQGIELWARYWGVVLALSLALSFVKGTGERKIDREKSIADGTLKLPEPGRSTQFVTALVARLMRARNSDQNGAASTKRDQSAANVQMPAPEPQPASAAGLQNSSAPHGQTELDQSASTLTSAGGPDRGGADEPRRQQPTQASGPPRTQGEER